MGSIKAVIFDMGGVILRTVDGGPRDRLAEKYGTNRAALESLVFGSESSARAEAGLITQAEHWAWVGAQLRLSPEELEDFIREFWSGDRVDLELVEYIQSLRPRYKTALLSNAWDGTREMVRGIYDFTGVFDFVVFSAEVRMRKPDPEAFRLVLDRLEVQPQEAVFVDDFPPNIEAARRMGLHVGHFQDPRQARRDLASLLEV